MKQPPFAPDHQQPNLFSFVQENELKARKIIEKYPPGRQASALVPLLDLAQRQNNNWLSKSAIRYVANLLNVAETRAFEVATFYSMFETEPVGRHCVSVCTNISCMLRGSDEIVSHLEERLGIKLGESTEDGKFYLKKEEECLAACCGAPMMMVDHVYHENLTSIKVDEILEQLD